MVLLVLLAPVAALNSILPSLGIVSSFYAITVVFVAYAWLRRRGTAPKSRLTTLVGVLGIGLGIRAVFALFLDPGNPAVRNESIVTLIGILLVLSVPRLPLTKRVVRALCFGWVVAFLVTGGLAVVEYLTGRRFGAHYLDAFVTVNDVGVAATFYNPNRYAAFVALALPIFIVTFALTARRFPRAVLVFITAGTIPVMLMTGSRLGIVIGVCFLALLLLMRGSIRLVPLVLIIGAVVLMVAQSLVPSSSSYWGDADYSISLLGFEITMDSSAYARWLMILNGLLLTASSPLWGWGPGGFTTKMREGGLNDDQFGVVNPHNGIIEFMSQFGLVALIVLLVVVARTLAVLLPQASKRNGDHQASLMSFAIVLAIIVLPVASTLPGLFLSDPFVWLAIATYYAVTLYLERSKRGDVGVAVLQRRPDAKILGSS